jgi:prepilin-type N-terminal cleavage/methylation domain-containing protein
MEPTVRNTFRRRHGFTLVELLVVMAIIGVLIALLVPAVQKARASAMRTDCQNRLKQMALALHSYHDAQGTLPPAYMTNHAALKKTLIHNRPPPNSFNQYDDPGWGWAALILPFLEEGNLADSINYQLPNYSPTNAAAVTTTLKVYTCPADSETGVFPVQTYQNPNFPVLCSAATISYAACYGDDRGQISTHPDQGNGVFCKNNPLRLTDVKDGTSNTFAIGERAALAAQAPWAGAMTGGTIRTTPDAPVYRSIIEPSPAMAMAEIGNRLLNSPDSEPYDFFSGHYGFVQFAFCDGSVHALSTSTNLALLQALASRAGGEILDGAEY